MTGVPPRRPNVTVFVGHDRGEDVVFLGIVIDDD
jgi:hypothetical protein